MTALVVLDDLNRLPDETKLRLFDPNATGAMDAAFAQRAIDDANSEIEATLGAYFPTLTAMLDNGQLEGAVDRVIKRHGVDMACYFAGSLYPGAGAMGHGPAPWRQKYEDAVGFFRRMAADWRARPPRMVAKTGIALPRGAVENTEDENGISTRPWNDVSDRKVISGF